MSALLPLLVLGGLAFEGQTIPGLSALVSHTAWNAPQAQFRRGDLDGDGAADLVLPDRVVFQRQGRFTENVAGPVAPGSIAETDLWSGEVYLRYADRLEVTGWIDGAWETVFTQSIDWPVALLPESDAAAGAATDPLRLRRFLHDINSDNVPELVLPAPDGLHVYVKQGNAYEHSLVDVLPARPSIFMVEDAGSRATTLVRGLWCHLFMDGSRLSTAHTPQSQPERIETRIWTLSVEEGRVSAEADGDPIHVGLPLHLDLQVCRLNGDALPDFVAQKEMHDTSGPSMPMPVWECAVSTDGGKTLQTVRAQATHPGAAFIDADRDGDADRVISRMALFDRGLREAVTRVLTDRTLPHEVLVHLQDKDGRFSTEPDLRWRGEIRLEGLPWQRGERLKHYYRGRLVNLFGDYDGDGRNDLAVMDEPRRVAVYRGTEKGFESDPVASIDVPEKSAFSPIDVDGDGRDDLVVEPYEDLIFVNGRDRIRTRVFFSREGAP